METTTEFLMLAARRFAAQYGKTTAYLLAALAAALIVAGVWLAAGGALDRWGAWRTDRRVETLTVQAAKDRQSAEEMEQKAREAEGRADEILSEKNRLEVERNEADKKYEKLKLDVEQARPAIERLRTAGIRTDALTTERVKRLGASLDALDRANQSDRPDPR